MRVEAGRVQAARQSQQGRFTAAEIAVTGDKEQIHTAHDSRRSRALTQRRRERGENLWFSFAYLCGLCVFALNLLTRVSPTGAASLTSTA
jgi:hypothetical protein